MKRQSSSLHTNTIIHQELLVGSLETQYSLRMTRNTLLAASNDNGCVRVAVKRSLTPDFAIEGTSLNRFGSNESRRFHIDPAG